MGIVQKKPCRMAAVMESKSAGNKSGRAGKEE